MSKIKTTIEFGKEIGNIRCELVSGSDVSRLEGKLKTLIDSILPEMTADHENEQRKATKDMVRLVIWDWFNFMTGHITDHLQEKKKWYKTREKNRKQVNIQAGHNIPEDIPIILKRHGLKKAK